MQTKIQEHKDEQAQQSIQDLKIKRKQEAKIQKNKKSFVDKNEPVVAFCCEWFGGECAVRCW